MTKATTKQVRNYYTAQGYDVRISRDGLVTFRDSDSRRLNGRHVDEYFVDEGGRVHLR